MNFSVQNDFVESCQFGARLQRSTSKAEAEIPIAKGNPNLILPSIIATIKHITSILKVVFWLATIHFFTLLNQAPNQLNVGFSCFQAFFLLWEFFNSSWLKIISSFTFFLSILLLICFLVLFWGLLIYRLF